MKIILQAGYQDRIQLKKLGAKWDAIQKYWYVIDPPNLHLLWNWLPDKYKTTDVPKEDWIKAFHSN
jgi:hypothetical protein